MTEHAIKSRPSYARLSLDPTGRRHLLVADSPDALTTGLAPGASAAEFDERWVIVGDSRAIPSTDEGACEHEFRSPQHLFRALRRRLSDERMGLRLYALGAERFLWNVNAVAHDHGMSRLEVHLCASRPGPRRVFCNHCRTLTEDVTTTIVACAGCRAPLLVRDHFSRRLNAFAGVQVDAEAPGEIPAIEELAP